MQKKTRNIRLIVITYGTMLLFGFTENIKGVSYPLIKAEFAASYEQQGLLVSLLSGSYVLFCLAAGFFLSRFGVKKSLLAGYACAILGLALQFFMPSFWSLGAALFLLYASFGFYELGVNALGTQLFTAKAALLMSLLHFFYGAGSILSPKIAGFLTNQAGMDWRWVYALSIPLVLILCIPALPARFPEEQREGDSSPDSPEAEKKITFWGALKLPMVWAFAITLGFMEVVEFSSANWGGLYFQDVYGLDPRTDGASFVSNFYILFTLSRLLSGFIIEKIGYIRSLFGISIMTVAVYALGFVLGRRGILALPLLGFFIAPMWPTMMAVAMGFFGKQAPVITGAIIVISGGLNAIIQLLIGFTNRYIGAAWGFRSCFVYALIMVGMLFYLNMSIKRQVLITGKRRP